MSKLKQLLNIDEFQPERSFESNLISVSSLLVVRGIMSLFQLIVLILMIVNNYDNPLTFGMFLTNFGFYGLTIYLWWSLYLSICAVLNPKTYIPFIYHSSVFHFIYQLFYESMLIYHFIISVIYWSLLASEDLPTLSALLLFLTIARHLFNFIFMFIELLLSRNLIYLSHYPILLSFGLLYICLAILVHHLHGIWAYSFLDYNENPLRFGIVLGGLYYLHKLRDHLFANRYRRIVPESVV
ncbi:hypothetical protein K502DRAFT_350296 [Neoconidiobolus thromboides FSU 785]|nr:hypothetical protein K502DRAFT_350296 [Neoconidiobolus thromboides FSU 785]